MRILTQVLWVLLVLGPSFASSSSSFLRASSPSSAAVEEAEGESIAMENSIEIDEMEYLNADIVASPLDGRSLQAGLWGISRPRQSYSGLQLNLEHIVRDQVRLEYVKIEVFRDADCRFVPGSPNYIRTDVINDLSAFGDGSGSRTMTVNYNINPATISNSRMISFSGDDPVVSFCTRFSLFDPADPDQPANSLETNIAIRVDITERFEILGIVESSEGSYGAEAFECDLNNNPISNPTIKSQGSSVRICVQPNEAARNDGVVMRSINNYQLVRGDVLQDVIVPDGVTKDLTSTQYRCTPGSSICHADTIISNSFFYSRGIVTARGQAWLQYGLRRHMVEIRPQNHPRKDHDHLRLAESARGAPRDEASSEITSRKVQEAGAFIGAREFSFEFEVAPSGTSWEAVAYFCNGRNVKLSDTEASRPRNKGDDIRVCVRPSEEARSRGVYMRGISSFYFQQDERVQFAVEEPGIQSEDTLYICNAGETLCAFKTKLSDNFFDQNLKVQAVGQVLLQYGKDPLQPSIARRVEVILTDDQHSHRAMQNTLNPTIDAGFAGRSEVNLEFETDPVFVPPSEKTWQDKSNEWWKDTPLFLRICYVLALIVGIVIFFCFLWAIFFGNPFDRKIQAEEYDRESTIFIQPVYVHEDQDSSEEDEIMKPASKRSNSTAGSSSRSLKRKNSKRSSVKKLEEGNAMTDEGMTVSPKPKSTRKSIKSLLFLENGARKSLRSLLFLENGGVGDSPEDDAVPTTPEKKRASRKESMSAGEGIIDNGSTHSGKRRSSKSPRQGTKKKVDGDTDGTEPMTPTKKTSRNKSLYPGDASVASGGSGRLVGRKKSVVSSDATELTPPTPPKRIASKSPRSSRITLEGDDNSSRASRRRGSASQRRSRISTEVDDSSFHSSARRLSKSPMPSSKKKPTPGASAGNEITGIAAASPRRRASRKLGGDGLGSSSAHSRKSTSSRKSISSRKSVTSRRSINSPVTSRPSVGIKSPKPLGGRRASLTTESPRVRRPQRASNVGELKPFTPEL